jgi:hypothetical protein
LIHDKTPVMKKTFFALVLSLATLNAAWAQFNSDKALYASKVERYTRMSKTGATLTAVGGVLFIAGIVMISNSPSTTTYNNFGQPQTTYTGGQAVGGALAIIAGVGGVGAGIPLWIIGSKNKTKYEQKLELTGFQINPRDSWAGTGIRYRF